MSYLKQIAKVFSKRRPHNITVQCSHVIYLNKYLLCTLADVSFVIPSESVFMIHIFFSWKCCHPR